MNIHKILCSGMLAAALLAGSGCHWFDTGEDPGDGAKIPAAASGDPQNDLNIDGAQDGWTAGADAGSLAAKAGDWTPVQGLNFPTVYFAYDRDALGTSEKAKLEKVASYLKAHTDLGLIIEGHCDDRGSNEYNRALGERRAISVRAFLVSMGVPDSRIKTMSYGEDRPAMPGVTPAARSKNRRAELIPAKMQ